jgi:uncharacterized delta-60 repeat protein
MRILLLFLFINTTCSCFSQLMDSSFGTNGVLKEKIGFPRFTIWTSCIQDDGKIIIAGSASNTLILSRFHTNGSVDNTFGNNGTSYPKIESQASATVVLKYLPSGKILLGRYRESSGGQLFRLNSNGTVDSSFGTNGMASTPLSKEVSDIGIQSDNKIVVCNSQGTFRFFPDGRLDQNFRNQNIPLDAQLLILSNDKILLFDKYSDGTIKKGPRIYRYNSDGSVDKTFGNDGITSIDIPRTYRLKMKVRIDNSIDLGMLIRNNYNEFSPDTINLVLAHCKSDGRIDSSFGTEGIKKMNWRVHDLNYFLPQDFIFTSEDKILFAGTNINDKGIKQFAAFKINKDGTTDNSFGNNGIASVTNKDVSYAGLLPLTQKDGKIIITGYEFGSGRFNVAITRMESNGNSDNNFGQNGISVVPWGYDSNYSSIAQDMILKKDGKIITGGFSNNGMFKSIVLAQFNSNGVKDNTFGNNGQVNIPLDEDTYWSVSSVSSWGQTYLYLVQDSQENTYALTPSHDFAQKNVLALYKFKSNGNLDSAFGYLGKKRIQISSNGSRPIGMVMQADGKLIIAGTTFRTLTDSTALVLTRITSTGVIDPTFGNSGILKDKAFNTENEFRHYNQPRRLAIQSDGKILVTGKTNESLPIGFAVRRYNIDGSIDSKFGEFGSGMAKIKTLYADATSIALQPDGKILVGGNGWNGGMCAVRYETNGFLDETFGNRGIKTNIASTSGLNQILLQPDGKIVLLGTRGIEDDEEFFITVARLVTDGGIDSSFSKYGSVTISEGRSNTSDLPGAMAIDAKGRILICGATDLPTHYNISKSSHTAIWGLTNSVNPCPINLSEAGTDKTLCTGTGGILIGSGKISGNIYSWFPTVGLSESSIAQPIANPSVTTTYYLTVTNTSGCVAKDSVKVTVLQSPLANAGPDRSICLGTNIQVGIAGERTNSYLWSSIPQGFTSTVANPFVNPTVTTTYILFVSGNSCYALDTVIVNLNNANSKIDGFANAPISICIGNSYNLTFSSTNTPDNALIQLWEKINNNNFSAGMIQTYKGLSLNFPVTNTVSGTKKYFFTINPPPGNSCFTASNSDTATIKVDQLTTPLITLNNKTLAISNPEVDAIYNWQILQSGSWQNFTPVFTGISYTTKDSGTFRVQAVKGNCLTYSNSLTVSSTVPAQGGNELGIYLYPNPTTGMLVLDSLKLSDNWVTVEIVSLDGSVIFASFNIENQTKVTIDVSFLNNGIYLAVLRTGRGTANTIKFVKI